MTPPEQAAGQFAAACLLGMGLGVWYEFLRPLRPKFTGLSDSLFLLGTMAVWVYFSFGICGGDLRLGPNGGLFLGGFALHRLLGRPLGRIFRPFWEIVGKIRDGICLGLKKISKIAKKLFASGEKWVTIKCNNRCSKRRRSGGPTHGKRKDPSEQYADNISEKRTPDQDHRDLRYRVVYRSADHPSPESE